MRSFIRIIIAAALAAVIPMAAHAVPAPLTVHVQDDSGVAVDSVTVAAIQWGMNGPSTYTLVGMTNSDGNASFSLELQMGYSIYVSSHGWSPSITDQFNDPEYNSNRHIWAWDATPVYSTFTLTNDLTGVGMITQSFINATPNKVLFGGLHNMISQMQGASGLVMTDGAGAGTLVVENVPFAVANTYNIGLYDPEKNKGIGRNVMSDLGDGSAGYPGTEFIAYTGGATLNFNQSIPPARVETNTQPGDGTASGASVEGVLVSTNGIAIPHMGLGIRACVGNQWDNWAHADENGRFQVYGLTPGVTYYIQAMGGCTWSNNGQDNKCYEPFSSPNYTAQDICTADDSLATSNDIVYVSSDVMYHSVTLNEMPPSIGEIQVCVKSSDGDPIPNANVNINPDGSPWPADDTICHNPNNFTTYFSTNFINNQGFSNANVNTGANGCALLDGLPSGNYMINVWTPFSGGQPVPFNAGADEVFTSFGMNGGGMDWQKAHCDGTGGDDYRITVDTDNVQTMYVYDSSGAVVNDAAAVALSSITYMVSLGGNDSGVVRGNLTFPSSVNLANTPIVITLYGQCMDMNTPCPAGNFKAVTGSGQTIPYSINVSSGFSYWMNVKGMGWGRVQRGGGDNSIHLQTSSSAIVNMEFAPAGIITGTVYKPDTSIFTPASNQWVWVDAGNDSGWTGTQLQKDGTFEMTDVLTGVNRISINVSGEGAFNYAVPSPRPTVTVVAGATSTVNINLVNANYVGIDFDPTKTPDSSVVSSEHDSIIGFKVMPVTAGTVIKGETIAEMLFGKDGDQGEFRYSSGTVMGHEGPCGQGWPGGFCATTLPSPAIYDFYLMRSGDFGDPSESAGGDMPYPHFVLLSSSKNVIVSNDKATGVVWPAYSQSSSSGVIVNLTPATDMSARGNATLAGTVTAENFFRQADYDSLGGDFEAFIEYLPVATLYDANGAFKAAGIVLPPPSFIADKEDTGEFEAAFSGGFTQFKNLFSDPNAALGFQIRGLAPSECYTAVFTTPNYPPYQTRACVGVNGSTTTMTVNLDTAVGAGATVQGTVTSTAAVILPNVTVTMSGEAVGSRSAITDSSGTYKFEGLAPGSVRLKVSVDGYATGEGEEDLVGSNSYTRNFALTAAGGSITGTVYSQKLPYAKVQAGANIVAYNDTYNGTHPDSPLPLIKTQTGADGTYRLTGLIPGDVYKVFLKVPGKYTLNQTTTTISGNLAGIDFTMLPKPLDIEVFAKKGDVDFEFTVLNPQDFKDGWVGWSAYPFNGVSASTVTMTQLSSGELSGKIPLSALTSGVTYVLHGDARSYSNKRVTRELLFGKDYNGNTLQNIDDLILGDDSEDDTGRKNNELAMDKSGDNPSGITFPPGAVQAISTGAIPTCSFKGEGVGSDTVADKVAALGADAFAGDLYTVALTSVTANDNKSIELTLAYDKTTADLDDLSVARYNDTTSSWEEVPAVATINPLKGTVKVRLRTLASVLSVRPGAATPQVNHFDGRQYRVSAAASGSSSGTFAVIRPSVAGDAYSGAKLKVFNYPNPFSLKAKTVANTRDGGVLATTTNGTFIRMDVPAANGGTCHVRIYTLAGELVNDLTRTCTAGVYNYIEWNGRNKGGQEVANGVYYGVVELSGRKPKLEDATFKMVVVK